jgi:DNA-binding LacI/PurR family transcriptional regulator
VALNPAAVTIRDVARLSNVSVATVTRALQGHPRVRPETAQRVKEAAAMLGYRPSSIARALVTGASHTLGLLIPSSGASFWGQVAAAIDERAVEEGYAVLLAQSYSDGAREQQMAEVLAANRVDGIITGAATLDPGTWFHRNERRVPIALVAGERSPGITAMDARRLPARETLELISERNLLSPGVSHVHFDEAGAARLASNHLCSLGHTRIAFLGASARRSSILRVLGFRLALEEARMPAGHVISCDPTLEQSQQAAEQLLSRDSRPTAIVAYDDRVAIGVLRGARALGLRVPEDVSIVGFDDIDIAAYLEPPLTTVRQQARVMGRLAIDMLLEALRGKPPADQIVRGELIIRGSTAPPRAS